VEPTEAELPTLSKALAINLALDEYDDIFSDFDPRPFSQRALSEDFLYELKRASLAKEESGLNVVLMLPKDKRFAGQEHLIRDRLKEHFKRHRRQLQEKLKSQRISGLKMAALGVVFMFIATYLLTYTVKNIWTTFIVVLLEPAGWFTFWEGLDQIVFRAKEITPDLAFYRKMTGAKINFISNPEKLAKTDA
jgi:hypothetical protein